MQALVEEKYMYLLPVHDAENEASREESVQRTSHTSVADKLSHPTRRGEAMPRCPVLLRNRGARSFIAIPRGDGSCHFYITRLDLQRTSRQVVGASSGLDSLEPLIIIEAGMPAQPKTRQHLSHDRLLCHCELVIGQWESSGGSTS